MTRNAPWRTISWVCGFSASDDHVARAILDLAVGAGREQRDLEIVGEEPVRRLREFQRAAVDFDRHRDRDRWRPAPLNGAAKALIVRPLIAIGTLERLAQRRRRPSLRASVFAGVSFFAGTGAA